MIFEICGSLLRVERIVSAYKEENTSAVGKTTYALNISFDDGNSTNYWCESKKERDDKYEELKQMMSNFSYDEGVLLEDAVEVGEREAERIDVYISTLKSDRKELSHCYCSSCQHTVDVEDIFCKMCGARLIKRLKENEW